MDIFLSTFVKQTIIPLLRAHLPAGSSLKQFYHYGQLVRSHRFCQYDFGERVNRKVYHQPTPPDYNLKKCTVPVGIFYADADSLAAAQDVIKLPYELPNVIEMRRVNDDTFNHVDFLLATDAKSLVYDYIFDVMRKIDKNSSEQVGFVDVGDDGVGGVVRVEQPPLEL